MKRNKFWLIILAVIALLAVGAFLLLQLSREVGSQVEIAQDGAILYTLPLSENRELSIPSAAGHGYNMLSIQDGKVEIIEASCPDQICVKRGATRFTADPIVCLPNKLVITVTGSAAQALDGVTS